MRYVLIAVLLAPLAATAAETVMPPKGVWLIDVAYVQSTIDKAWDGNRQAQSLIDPIPRYEFYLEKRGHDIRAIREQIDERTKRIVQQAVDFAEASPWPAPQDALEDLYAPSSPPSSSNGKA